MRIVCKVSAEFRGPDHSVLFSVAPDQRLMILEAPDAIRQDPLFNWLLADSSLSIAGITASQAELEADPVAGVTAEGKSAEASAASEAIAEGKTPSTRKKAVTP